MKQMPCQAVQQKPAEVVRTDHERVYNKHLSDAFARLEANRLQGLEVNPFSLSEDHTVEILHHRVPESHTF